MIRVKRIGDQLYELLDDVPFKIDDREMIVPKGFVTDFMSVPPSLEWIVSHDSKRYREPSIIHDYLYSKESDKYGVTRKEADKFFMNECILNGVRWTRAKAMYLGLRMFGGGHWKKE